jgi:hypothetical protein
MSGYWQNTSGTTVAIVVLVILLILVIIGWVLWDLLYRLPQKSALEADKATAEAAVKAYNDPSTFAVNNMGIQNNVDLTPSTVNFSDGNSLLLNPKGCQQLCKSDVNCKAVTFKKILDAPNAPGDCILYSGTGVPVLEANDKDNTFSWIKVA